MSEVGLLARMDRTAAARRLLDARMGHALLKDAAAELPTSYQTFLKWEARLADAPLISDEFPEPPELPNGKKMPREVDGDTGLGKRPIQYGDALALVLAFHEDPDGTDDTPPPDAAKVAAALRDWIGRMAALKAGPKLRAKKKPAHPVTLEQLGVTLGMDKFYLSRVAHEKIEHPNVLRLRKIAKFLDADARRRKATTPPLLQKRAAGAAQVHA